MALSNGCWVVGLSSKLFEREVFRCTVPDVTVLHVALAAGNHGNEGATKDVRVRFHIIRNARIENVGQSQSCMVSNLRIIRKQTVGGHPTTTGSWHMGETLPTTEWNDGRPGEDSDRVSATSGKDRWYVSFRALQPGGGVELRDIHVGEFMPTHSVV